MGILIRSSATDGVGAGIINGNAFVGYTLPGSFAIFNDSQAFVDVSDNWWGDPDGPTGAGGTGARVGGGTTGNVVVRSSLAQSPLFPPTDLEAVVQNGTVVLSWTPLSNATAYNIYGAAECCVSKENYTRAEDGNKYENVLPDFSLTDLRDGATYHFVITSVNGSQESAESPPVTFVLELRQPQDTPPPRNPCCLLSGVLGTATLGLMGLGLGRRQRARPAARSAGHSD